MEFDRNPTLDALCARKSVRVFTEEPVPQAVKNALFQAAMQAPTAGNQMLYTILDITDAALKARLADLCDHQPFIADAPVVLVFVADCQRWYDGFAAAGCAPRPPREGDLLLAAADAAIAAQNTVVAAESFGLGSCYIGDILENCEDVRSALALPPYAVPAAMLVLGLPTPEYYHLPLLVNAEGVRLSKREKSLDMGALRARFTPAELTGWLAFLAGQQPAPEPVPLRSLAACISWEKVPRRDITVPARLLNEERAE